MNKTKVELNELKTEYEILTKKLQELTEEELKQIAGGNDIVWLKEESFNDGLS